MFVWVPQMVYCQNAADREDVIFGYDFLTVCLFVQAVGWIAQFIGHGVFEGRAPALGTNVFFLTLANFFVIFEFLYFAFGYRSGKEMQKIE